MQSKATLNAPAAPSIEFSQLNKLIQKQREFFNSQATFNLSFRKEQLRCLLSLIKQNEQVIGNALYEDFRKPVFETFITEVGFVEQELKETLRHLTEWAKPRSVNESLFNFPASSATYPEPYGLVFIIGPWNYPLQLVLSPLIGAMAAGNCAIIKPSELTANTSAVIAELIRKNFDEAYLAVVEGGMDTTQHLLQKRFDYIFFTGTPQVGRLVMKAAAEHLTPLTLELGGKSPAIVTEDADLELAARRIVWGKFLNAGQTCVAPDYVLVQEQVKEEFVMFLEQNITAFYGADPAISPDFARIIDDRNFRRLNNLLTKDNIRFGGQTDRDQRYIAPTILDNVTWTHPSMQAEIFGPILPVLSYCSLKDAIKTVNSQETPLALYFFSSDHQKQQCILQKAHFGGGCINDTMSHFVNPNLPFGGVGHSGFGSYHGRASFDLFSHHKSVLHRGTWLDLPLRYPPYKDHLSLVKKILVVV
ncbi:aldehyde dehydrogenase [Pontibacter harenae]|uniref:aldehyde dehydrogenase n=1 Tax=Pontibacter harenae TaxID=2894083 RepID=UPI001E40A8FF|nr:aldehyde dehydrogenase [Pontibacter harenae]MCC9169139.1 aldehyde dehydrogenase [Pontibacter harenae]